MARSCKPEFYDAHEDSEGLPSAWSLDISSAGIDERLSEAMDMQLQDTEFRATFCTREGELTSVVYRFSVLAAE